MSASDAIANLGRHGSDERGSVVILFALSLAVIMGLGGAAIDYGRITEMQRRITRATDLTAEAAARRPDLLDRDLSDFAQRFFVINGGERAPARDVRFRIDGSSDGIRIKVEAKLPTSIMGMLGRPYVPIVVERQLRWRVAERRRRRGGRG
jgi:Flp pilus assembly protein TadG